ncbi:hypothetical protein PINS_up009405 [Pythium insidiosum]|nr:hypothetical protein PINS_up009405 [Pythium insidiosum]
MAGGFHLPTADERDDGPRPAMTARDARRERYMAKTRAEAAYLFKFLIITQVVVYLEAGAIPCLLDQLSVDLDMSATQQGALGGVVYFALSAASPLFAYCMHRFNPQHILGASLVLNNFATLMLALTPTGYSFSAYMMIAARALIGFTQAFPCIYTPLWVDEYAPREKVAGWMSYLQGSVPMGVMLGYFVGTVANWFVPEEYRWFQTWRWPFVVQFVAMCPIMIAVFFVPKKHLVIRSEGQRSPANSIAVSSSESVHTDPISDENRSIETAEEILARATLAMDDDDEQYDDEYLDDEDDKDALAALEEALSSPTASTPREDATSVAARVPLPPSTTRSQREVMKAATTPLPSSTNNSQQRELTQAALTPLPRSNASEAITGERVSSESAPLLRTDSVRSELPPRSKRTSRLTATEPTGLFDYIEEAIKLGTKPPLSWSGPNHEEEDVLLASATMYGVASQRGLRQLHHNQQSQQIENEVGSSSFRRSFVSSTYDGSPEVRRTASAAAPSGFPEGGQLAALTVSRIPSIVEPQTTAPLSASGYGAFDPVARSPLKSPTMSLLEASILEEEFLEAYEQGSFSDGIRELLRIPIFCLIVTGLTAVYFVVTGVQYWSTIFMIKSLHASKYLVNGLFVLVAGTGPIFGVFFGGWLIDRCGGYIGVQQRATALGICMALGVTAFAISAATTFFDDIYITASFLWLLLFFGGSILPACTGIFISVVPAQHRALASSFSVMVFNLIGYSLSPYLTGLVMEWVLSHQGQAGTYFEGCDEACAYRVGFRFCLFWSVWSFVCIGGAWIIARREAAEKAKEELEILAAFRFYTPSQAVH